MSPLWSGRPNGKLAFDLHRHGPSSFGAQQWDCEKPAVGDHTMTLTVLSSRYLRLYKDQNCDKKLFADTCLASVTASGSNVFFAKRPRP